MKTIADKNEICLLEVFDSNIISLVFNIKIY